MGPVELRPGLEKEIMLSLIGLSRASFYCCGSQVCVLICLIPVWIQTDTSLHSLSSDHVVCYNHHWGEEFRKVVCE